MRTSADDPGTIGRSSHSSVSIGVCFFDLDGTIVDSREPIRVSLNRALTDHGLREVEDHEVGFFIGPPLRQALRAYLRDRGEHQSIAESLVRSFRKEYEVLSVEMANPYPRIHEVLSLLADRAHLGVVTSKPTRFAKPILERIDLASLFEIIEGADPGGAEAKDLTLRRAMRRWTDAVPSSNMAMVGDRHYDIDAGRALGLLGIGVTWGFGTRQELVDSGADSIVSAPDELPGLLGFDAP